MTCCRVMAIQSFSHTDRTSENGDRTRRPGWFYILSNAGNGAMQCIGQTI